MTDATQVASSTLARLWNRLAKTEPVSAEDFIGWAIDRYGFSDTYLQEFNRWNDRRLGWME